LKLFWDRERPASSDFTLGKKKKFAEVISIGTVVGKLLLKSNCVTLLPLLLKETSYFDSVTQFSL
jgi:hypothetical protein